MKINFLFPFVWSLLMKFKRHWPDVSEQKPFETDMWPLGKVTKRPVPLEFHRS